VMCVAFFANEKRLVSASLDRSLRIWNYTEGTLESCIIMDAEDESIYTLCLIHDSTWM